MPRKFEIMREVREGLNSLEVNKATSDTSWTRAVKTKLCEIGCRFDCNVYASRVDQAYSNGGEWLYDVTWLKYEKCGRGELVGAHLAAECEWGNVGDIEEDFEKLLLTRAGVRLMIFDGNYKPGSEGIAKRLAEKVGKFKGSRDQDAWLLAAWEKSENSDKGWEFKYFTIERNAAVLFPPLSGG